VQRPDIGNGTNSVYAVAVDDVQHGELKFVAPKECKQGTGLQRQNQHERKPEQCSRATRIKTQCSTSTIGCGGRSSRYKSILSTSGRASATKTMERQGEACLLCVCTYPPSFLQLQSSLHAMASATGSINNITSDAIHRKSYNAYEAQTSKCTSIPSSSSNCFPSQLFISLET
jgi:hypothetical protein